MRGLPPGTSKNASGYRRAWRPSTDGRAVADPFEREPVRRRRTPRAAAVARGEQRRHLARAPPSRPDLDQGARQVPDHVAQEPRALEAERDRAARRALDVEPLERALGGRDVRSG